MIGKEGETVDVGVVLQAVQLHARVIIHVEVALLGHRVHHLVMKEPTGEGGRGSSTAGNLQETYVTSRTTSRTWNSQPSFLSLQSKEAM